MIDLGFVKPGSTIYIPFPSYAGSTGASAATTGLAVGDIRVYKDGNTTERASTSGFTLSDTDGLDFDTLTGINGFSIDLSDNTTAGFWAAGSRYWVIVADVTIDSQTVRFIAATFTIGLPGAVLNTTIATLSSQTSFTLTAGPAEDDALNGCIVYIHDVASAAQGGFAVVQDYTGSTKTVTLVAGTTFTAAASDNIMIMPPALVPTAFGRTLDVSSTGEAGVDWANVGSQSTSVNLSATTTNVVNTATNVTTVNGLAANVITAASMNADASAEIADAVWDEDATAHQTGGTFGQAIGDPGADTNTIFKAVVTDATGATVGVDVVAIKAETASIQTDTNDLQTQIGTAGDGLTNINLPNQTMDIVGNITGNLSGSVGSVTGAVGSVTGNVGGNVTGSVGSVVGLTASNLDATVSSRSTFAPTDALTESYATDGSTFTMAQALYQIWSLLAEANASGTTITCKRLDGSTTSMTFTIDNAATPATITRAS